MKILITGSTGFVGRHLVPKLLVNGHEVTEVTIEPEVSEQLYGTKTNKILVSKDQDEFTSIIENAKPEAVIHLASFLTAADDFQTLEKLLNVNLVFYCRLLDALKNCDIRLFVNTGTFAEYFKGDGVFNPAYLYSATKTASRSFLDYYSKVYNFKQATVVPYTIYGGNDTQKKIIDIIYDSIGSKVPVDLSPGEQVLDFIHVDDVADFYCTLIEKQDKLEHKTNFQLGTGVGTTLKQLAIIIEQATGKTTNINWGGKPYRPADVMYAVANVNHQNIIFGWQPVVDINNGVRRFLSNK